MLSEKYEIRFWQDSEYAVYKKGDFGNNYLFIGTIEEVYAWIKLTEEGFNL